MSTYSNRLQPALQNLLQRVVWFFHPRLSCMTMHISADVQRITLNASCMMISGERTEQLDIFCHVTGFTSDFLSFVVVELIRFHGALQLTILQCQERSSWVLKTVETFVEELTALHRSASWWGGGCCPVPRISPLLWAFGLVVGSALIVDVELVGLCM